MSGEWKLLALVVVVAWAAYWIFSAMRRRDEAVEMIGDDRQLDRIEKKVDLSNERLELILVAMAEIEGFLNRLITQGESIMGELQDLEKALNTIQKSNAEIAADLEKILANQNKLAKALAAAAAVGSAAKAELEKLTDQAEQIASDIQATEQKADAASGGTKPDQGLPSGGAHPDQGLPSGGARPDQGLPSGGARPDQGLPPSPGHPSGQPVPGGGRPDQGLPPTGQPKKR